MVNRGTLFIKPCLSIRGNKKEEKYDSVAPIPDDDDNDDDNEHDNDDDNDDDYDDDYDEGKESKYLVVQAQQLVENQVASSITSSCFVLHFCLSLLFQFCLKR